MGDTVLVKPPRTKDEICVESLDPFSKRGRQLARAEGRGDRIRPSKIVVFEDPQDLLRHVGNKRKP